MDSKGINSLKNNTFTDTNYSNGARLLINCCADLTALVNHYRRTFLIVPHTHNFNRPPKSGARFMQIQVIILNARDAAGAREKLDWTRKSFASDADLCRPSKYFTISALEPALCK